MTSSKPVEVGTLVVVSVVGKRARESKDVMTSSGNLTWNPDYVIIFKFKARYIVDSDSPIRRSQDTEFELFPESSCCLRQLQSSKSYLKVHMCQHSDDRLIQCT